MAKRRRSGKKFFSLRSWRRRNALLYSALFILRRTNVVMNYTEIEAKVREATNDEAWGPTGKQSHKYSIHCKNKRGLFTVDYLHSTLGQLMQEIAQSTFTYEQFLEVMGMLWKRMLGERKNWRRTYKVGYLCENVICIHYSNLVVSFSHFFCSII